MRRREIDGLNATPQTTEKLVGRLRFFNEPAYAQSYTSPNLLGFYGRCVRGTTNPINPCLLRSATPRFPVVCSSRGAAPMATGRSSWCLQAGPYLGEMSALCFVPLPRHPSSPLLLAGKFLVFVFFLFTRLFLSFILLLVKRKSEFCSWLI